MQAVRSRELADWLNRQHVFPVSPNTLLMTLQTIALVHKWYGSRAVSRRAAWNSGKPRSRSITSSRSSKNVGKRLTRRRKHWTRRRGTLKTYRGRVSALSGQEQPEPDSPKQEAELPLIGKASAYGQVPSPARRERQLHFFSLHRERRRMTK